MERKVVTGNKGSYRNITILNHHLLRDYHIYSLEKLNTKELYCFSICFSKKSYLHCKNSSRRFFLDFNQMERCIYIVLQLVAINGTLRMF